MRIFWSIFKGIIEIFNFFFNYKRKYEQKNFRYQGKSLSQKIFLIVEMIAIPCLVLAFGAFVIPQCEVGTIQYVVAVLGYILLGIATVEFLITNTILGFRNMVISKIRDHIERDIKDAINQNFEITENGIEIKEDGDEIQESNLGPIVETNGPNNEKEGLRKIDLTIGILGIILIFAFIGLATLIGSMNIVL